jgi:hypothetical protein
VTISDEMYKELYIVQGFLSRAGHLGYLREAYHHAIDPIVDLGSEQHVQQHVQNLRHEFDNWEESDSHLYATYYLFKEAWKPENKGIPRISGEELQRRLPIAMRIQKRKCRELYGLSEDHEDVRAKLKSYEDFVNLFLEKEKAGLNPYVVVSY